MPEQLDSPCWTVLERTGDPVEWHWRSQEDARAEAASRDADEDLAQYGPHTVAVREQPCWIATCPDCGTQITDDDGAPEHNHTEAAAASERCGTCAVAAAIALAQTTT